VSAQSNLTFFVQSSECFNDAMTNMKRQTGPSRHWVTLTFDLAFCSAICWAKP